MIVLRGEQIEALRRPDVDAFRRERTVALRTLFPDETASLDDAALRAHVDAALAGAAAYGLVRKRDLCRFLDLTVLFGLNWKERPERRWMHDILTDRTRGEPGQRLESLVRQALYRLEERAD